MAKKHCEHCGSSMVEYRHSLNKFLLEGLVKLKNANGPINLKDLKLDRNQWDNFQKLRYWELVSKSYTDEGKRIGGTWHITEKGKYFLEGKIKIHYKVVTYRGNAIRFEGAELSIDEFKDSFYKQKIDYAEESTEVSFD